MLVDVEEQTSVDILYWME
uniref:Uncharacterized protein n=1 Tax=Ralstonia solanacearum TaxID=305 RepID=A0A0S4TPU1_RALSL|nr:protein of unknown function [Ralstonia solanacearum]